ncbi:MAG: preprotein translocase subunit SecY [Nitrospirae bacterium RBG_19FT_COMBO_42_15]|nr:MAG: preprotein translocase subunit SecY [Nitrospirae bacterium RBG_19FT_COMBO_42_15]
MISSFQNILKIPELRIRLFFTLAMLAVYRVGAHIPTPGINNEALGRFLTEKGGALMGFFDMFSGGALSKLSIFALGIMPYISASIILQLLTVAWPHLQALAKEGEAGRKKIIQYTRYGTIVISIIQSTGIAIGLEGMSEGIFVQSPGWSFRIMTIITLTAGTAFIMWLGEQITERGIGNGISLIIFAGIVAQLPSAITNTIRLSQTGEIKTAVIAVLLAMMFIVIAAIVYLEGGRRKIAVQYAKRIVGRKVYGGQSTYIPLKINTAGVIPPIFASSLLAFPATIAGFIDIPWVQSIARQFAPGGFIHIILYAILIIFFCFFYTAVVLNPVDLANNMQKYGGFIPGVRPGQRTADYIYSILTKITFGGAMYLAAICVLPEILILYLNVPFYFGGTSLLIVIGVGLDTVQQIESHLITRHYEGFMKKGKIKGRIG